jgi:NAD(P)-dependent dehydrogenase (short-subunit alcohol dehydrogenase family)
MGRMQDRVVAITGAAHGIGAAIARRFAEEGAVLVLVDMDGAQLERTAADLRRNSRRVTTIVADVTEEAPVAEAFARIAADHGRLDVLVNDVGGARNAKVWEMSAADWDATIKLNLRSAFLCTRAACKPMMAQKAGAIVCLSSGAREGTPWTAAHTGGAAYAAAKAGIHGFIRDVAFELADYNIRVNAVAPGPIDTERTSPGFEGMRDAEYSPWKLVPMKRIGTPKEVADAVLYLASDEASYITGTTLNVAGGR